MILDSHKQAFVEEASELLAELEQSLLELEDNKEDKELIAKVFRALHTIKGSSGMFGYDEMAKFTHDIENVYDRIRNGELSITKEIIDVTLKARDQLLIMLKGNDSKNQSSDEEKEEILNEFRTIVEESTLSIKKEPIAEIISANIQPEAILSECSIYLIHFRPAQEIFLSGTNPSMLLAEIAELGDTIILGHTSGIPLLKELNPEFCYTYWDIILRSDKGLDAIKDVFIFVGDENEMMFTKLDSNIKVNTSANFEILRSILSEKQQTELSEIEEIIQSFETAVKTFEVKQEKVEQKKLKDQAAEGHHHEDNVSSSLRVSSEKLDELVNLVSELVTIQARLVQIASQSYDPMIVAISEEVERITWALRDSALNIRMLRIGTTFSKFKRLVRDLSKELGKEVDLTTEGADTELDKTVLEKLNDPLIHIIRNSIDHGVESPEEREQNNKVRMGTVKLSATQAGGNVLIRISDDGAGIDKEKIKAKAIQTGLIAANAELSDSEIYGLIFAPGFSTASKVTSVSGRGVGMDVVRRAIEALRGTVEVTSKLTVGTTITLKLPLTLAIIDGLLVRIGDATFVLPLSSVEECIELMQKDIDNMHQRNIVNIRGDIIPYIDLRDRFEIEGIRPKIQQVVIVGIEGGRVGFLVDEVIGQHQTVLKTLGKAYKNVEGISGATILGDGSVALIVDVVKLADKAAYEEQIAN